jgi:hypothetical protein
MLVHVIEGFSPVLSIHNRLRATTWKSTSTCCGATSNNDDSSMALLQKRIHQVTQSESTLPLVVLDAMLPRQRLIVNVNHDLLIMSLMRGLVKSRLKEETPYFGMLGMTRSETLEPIHLSTGVQVEIVGKPQETDGGLNLELKAGKRFRIEQDTVERTEKGWVQAQVIYLDSNKEDKQEKDMESMARARQMAKEFTDPNVSLNENKSLKDRWIELAREKEQTPGQIDQLLKDLGPIPSWEEPSECALWIGALINPIPAMGVALEIRPELLMAKSAEERTQIALNGIWNSIHHMQGPRIVKMNK